MDISFFTSLQQYEWYRMACGWSHVSLFVYHTMALPCSGNERKSSMSFKLNICIHTAFAPITQAKLDYNVIILRYYVQGERGVRFKPSDFMLITLTTRAHPEAGSLNLRNLWFSAKAIQSISLPGHHLNIDILCKCANNCLQKAKTTDWWWVYGRMSWG